MSIPSTATRYGAVTKSDATPMQFKAIYVGGTGNLAIKRNQDDVSAVTFSTVPAGTVLYVQVVRVMAATTCTNMVWMDW
mgnify:FL=1